jgi:hypothetical protein
VLLWSEFSSCSHCRRWRRPFADDACRCQGCGCKGGPSWRGPDGLCVSKASLAQTCGSPPASPCKQEGAARACFGKQSAVTTPKAKTEPQ